MTRILTAAFLATSLLVLTSPPAVSWDFFGWGPPPASRPAAPARPSHPPPARLPDPDITGSISASGEGLDDTVRLVAGLPPSANSPLAPLANDESWRAHARFFDRAFGELDRTQLTK